jgi:hypothetical protein
MGAPVPSKAMSNANSLSNLNCGPVGNNHATRHGARKEVFSITDQQELAELAELVREVTPVQSDALEPMIEALAIKLWRRNRLVADLVKHGVLRARGRSARHPAPSLEWLERVEAGIRSDFELLGLSLPSAMRLGLQLKQLEREREVDLEKLTTKQLRQLERLLDIAQVESNGSAAEISEK